MRSLTSTVKKKQIPSSDSVIRIAISGVVNASASVTSRSKIYVTTGLAGTSRCEAMRSAE